ncbi:hypothetical protein Ccrd_013357 [Cynara cardunculus var. scolymus]|uniref:Stress response protein NST1-like n=1 Tax=Cynara cardunculus var. scolymus TaxID=59895 RepID=A0A103YFR1_CYNCS|nr:hypothetical protein Ccrd_013357 [Cynara cardunculus var. scolymus]
MPPPRRKKWTEAEERTLIDKYGEMVCDGSLSKMKTREKKYKPIALHVNSIHHLGDPIVYPWEWSWKDVSNKVQNMRHQYSLVKQKIKRPGGSDPVVVSGGEGYDWVEGLTHWSNFLRYKEVFGDVTLPFGDLPAIGSNGFDENHQEMEIVEFGNLGQASSGGYVGGMDGAPNGVMGLEFDYDGGEGQENYNGNHVKEDGDNNGFVYGEIETMGSETRKKRKAVKNLEKKAWGFVANQLAQLREMEARFEQREEERERERQRRESLRIKKEEEREKQWEEREKVIEKLREGRNEEWEAMEKEQEERRRQRDEELIEARKWEERRNRRRCEWKARIDEMLSEHRAEMTQVQGRILEEQQNVTNQLVGMVSQWTGGISDNTSGSSHYFSQMMQNLQHVGGIVDGDARVEGHNEDDQFIVDG